MFLAREQQVRKPSLATVLKANAGRFGFAVILMGAFNFFSHGTQDLYPTFLRDQMRFTPHTTGIIAIVFNIGAMCGGVAFGTLSERIGRRRAIAIAALCALPAIPFWAYGGTPVILAAGGFVLQFAVQGAWGVVPVYLNEMSPDAVARDIPRLRLPDRQPDRLLQRPSSRAASPSTSVATTPSVSPWLPPWWRCWWPASRWPGPTRGASFSRA